MMRQTAPRPSDIPSRRAAPYVLVAVAVAYALALNNQWPIKPDSAMYLTLGRSLAEGRGMEFNGAQTWGVPPVVPFLIAGCRLLTGPNLWLVNLVISLFGFGTVALSYAMARRLAADRPAHERERLALGVLLIVGTSARLLIDSTRVLTDVPFVFWITLALYAFIRARSGHWAWCWLGFAAMLVSAATRLVGLILFPGVLAALVLDYRQAGYAKRLVATLVGAAAVAGAFVLWAVLVRPQSGAGSPDYIRHTFFQHFEFQYAWRWLRIPVGAARVPGALCESIVAQELKWFNLVPTALVALGMWAAARRRQWMVVCPTVLYIMFLVWMGSVAVAPRYLLAVMPVLAYGLLVGTAEAAGLGRRLVGGRREPADGSKWFRPAVTLVVGFCVVVSVPKAVRAIYRMRQPVVHEAVDRGKWADFIRLGEYLRDRGRPGDQVFTPEGAIVHHFSGVRTVAALYLKERDTFLAHYPLGPPAAIASLAARSPCRFVVIPTGKGPWGSATMGEMEATGAFAAGPKLFGNLALYERRGPGTEAAPDAEGGRRADGG